MREEDREEIVRDRRMGEGKGREGERKMEREGEREERREE